MKLKKKIRFFQLGKTISDIKEISVNDLAFEVELAEEYDTLLFKKELEVYLSSNDK